MSKREAVTTISEWLSGIGTYLAFVLSRESGAHRPAPDPGCHLPLCVLPRRRPRATLSAGDCSFETSSSPRCSGSPSTRCCWRTSSSTRRVGPMDTWPWEAAAHSPESGPGTALFLTLASQLTSLVLRVFILVFLRSVSEKTTMVMHFGSK